jgi:FkbM family methyltransferase
MSARTIPSRRLRLVDRVLQFLASRSSPVESEAAALDHLLPDGAVCFDIGAEYGLYTLTFARRVGARGRVLSFEPLPGPHRFLSRIVRWLRAPNVTVHRVALGDRVGNATLSLPRRRWLPVHGRAFVTDGADGPGPNEEFEREERVASTVSTVDGAVADAGLTRVDFIKIDVEGYEPAVLRGALRTLDRFRPTVLIEIEDRHLEKFRASSASVIDLLAPHGYQMTALLDGAWRPVETVSTRTRNYLFTADRSHEPGGPSR